MSLVTLPAAASAPTRQDWLPSLALHGGVLLGFIWLGTSQVQRNTQALDLDLELSWAPEQVTAAPPAPVATPPQLPKPLPQPASRPHSTAGKSSAPAPARAQPAPEPLRPETDAALPSRTQSAQPAPAPADMVAPSREMATQAAAQAPAPAVPTVPADDSAYQQWRSRLEQALQQRKQYPPSARRMGQAGKVTVHLRLGPDGELIACAVASSSGFQALDNAAEQLVRSVAQAMKAHAAPGRETDIRVPVVYALTES